MFKMVGPCIKVAGGKTSEASLGRQYNWQKKRATLN